MGINRIAIAIVATLAALGAALSAHPAEAAAGATQPSAADAPRPDPRAEALVRRYLAAIHFERTMDQIQKAMLPVIAERQSSLTAEQREQIIEIVRQVIREKMTPQLIDRMTPIYASTFTIDELDALVTFYESPVGRSITDKIPSLAPKSADVVRELMPGVMRDVMREVAKRCPQGKCDAATPKAAAS